MIISVQHRFALLAMPKCASHSLADAIAGRADIWLHQPPGAKHCNYRKFNRHLRPFLNTYSDGPIETLCLMREPIDWLGSWWRYRRRPALDGKPNSTKDISFDTFVERCLDRVSPGDTIGRQSRFVADKDGGIGVDHVFRYERIDALTDWIAERTGWEMELQRLNVSRPAETVISPQVRARAEVEMARDFEIYASLA